MQEYLGQVRSIQEKFEVFDLSHVLRSGNTHADSLATLATSLAQDLPQVVLVEDLYTQALAHQGAPRIHQIMLGPSWMDSISCSWKKMYCLRKSLKLIKCKGKLLGSGFPRIENCTSALSVDLICCVCTQGHPDHF